MKHADRLKFTATGTTAATITVGAAVTGMRTLAQVITDGANDPLAIKVGDTGVPFTVQDGSGHWEDILGTITSTTVITRTSTTASSNGGAAATFDGNGLTVMSAVQSSFVNTLPTAVTDTAAVLTEVKSPDGLSLMVFSPYAPKNTDGRRDGTIWYQTTPIGSALVIFLKSGGVYKAMVNQSADTGAVALTQVANGTFAFNAKSANTSYGNRSIHTAAEALTSIKAVFANWYTPGGGAETGTTAASTIKATLEYPVGSGNKYQFFFAGAVTGSIPDLTEIESDFLPIAIPAGAEFAIYSSWTNASGVPYFSFYVGDARAQGMASPPNALKTDISNVGVAGNYTALPAPGVSTNAYSGPIAIVGMSANKAVMAVGDNLAVGRGDSGHKYQGFAARAFGPVCAVGHAGSSGDLLSSFVASHARRVALARYFTHVVLSIGVNDVLAGVTAAVIQTNTNTAVKYFTDLGKKVALCTLTPVSADTASTWTATGTQTTTANNAVRIAVNTQRLAASPLTSVVYDLNLAVENGVAPEDGLWKASPAGAGQTADGTHPNATGYANIAANVNTSLLLNAAPITSVGGTTAPLRNIVDRVYLNQMKRTVASMGGAVTHTIMSPTNVLELEFWNGYINGYSNTGQTQTYADAGSGGPCNFTCQVQIGSTFYPALAADGTLTAAAADGQRVVMRVQLPFWLAVVQTIKVHTYQKPTGAGGCTTSGSTTGMPSNGSITTTSNPTLDICRQGAVADMTATGLWSTTGADITGDTVGPVAIRGVSVKPSVFIFGTSIDHGEGGYQSTVFNSGLICQQLATAGIGFTNGGIRADAYYKINDVDGTRPTRVAMANHPGITTVYLGGAVNDIAAGRSSNTIWAILQQIAALFPGKNIVIATVTPLSGLNGDGTQSPTSFKGSWIDLNNKIRTNTLGWKVIDIATALCPDGQPDACIWRDVSLTADGTHPSNAGYDYIRASGVVDPAKFL